MTTARSSAACTALRTNRMPSAAITMIGAEDPERDHDSSLERAAVVGALVVTEPHRVRWLLHARQQRREQVVLVVDQVGAVVVGQLVLVGHRQRPGRTGLDAQAAQDAAQVVDLVDAAVALAGAEPLAVRLVGVGRPLDVDRVGRAGPRAQLAADALLQAVGPAVELVPAVEARRRGQLLEGVLLGDDLPEHGPEGDPEPGDRVPELFLEGGHQACTLLSSSKVSGAAEPRTAPPVGIGGTGKPVVVPSASSVSSSAASPRRKRVRKIAARTPMPIRRSAGRCRPRGRSPGSRRPRRSSRARSG